MMLIWIIISVAGSAALALWAHERYYSYKYDALRQRVRHKARARRALLAAGADWDRTCHNSHLRTGTG